MGVEMSKLERCRVCGSGSQASWRRSCRDTSNTLDIRFAYVRCRDCRAAQLSSGPDRDAASAFYPDEYTPYNRPSPAVAALFDPRHSPRNAVQRALHQLYTPAGSDGARFLDYGCGSPATLNAAREAGWSTTGVDFSPLVVDAVRRAEHDALFPEDLSDGQQFDLVRGNHVIEHVYDPSETLRRLVRLLKPGGALHLATPNPDGVGSHVFRSAWFSLDAPRHVVLFPPDLLCSLLIDAGASRVEVLHEVTTKDLVRSGTYLLQALDRRRASDVTAGDGSLLLNRAMRPVAELAARIGKSDRYHVIAHAAA